MSVGSNFQDDAISVPWTYSKSSAVAEMGDRLATLDTARKVGGGGCCAPFRGGAGFPSNTMWPEPRPTCIPSGILIHSTVWPQYIIVTDMTNSPVAYGEPFYTNGRPKAQWSENCMLDRVAKYLDAAVATDRHFSSALLRTTKTTQHRT